MCKVIECTSALLTSIWPLSNCCASSERRVRIAGAAQLDTLRLDAVQPPRNARLRVDFVVYARLFVIAGDWP
ncbi:hypothetical protein ACNFCJ_05630 [Pseudomonas sp. NY15364]|uniref:hypothetical protein n=1 Tax=Pseudomonas sp. NY15364 TaxID=3400353 RepID=UPI003A8AF301